MIITSNIAAQGNRAPCERHKLRKSARRQLLAAVIIHALVPQSERWVSENYPSIGRRR